MGMRFLPRQILVLLLVVLWGLRLAGHIYLRNRNKKEDWRYAKFRKDFGSDFIIRSYLQTFMVQALFQIIIAVPIIYVMSINKSTFSWLDLLGVGIWFIGFIFEAVGDYQLVVFKNKKSNKGKIMKTGLWRFTRHPNYFGEVTMWWGIYMIALSTGGFYTMVGPLLITYLLLFVSGIPLLEQKYEGNREFEKYKKATSAFFPLPPKK